MASAACALISSKPLSRELAYDRADRDRRSGWRSELVYADLEELRIDESPTIRPSRCPDTGAFNRIKDPRAIRTLVDECIGLKSTVEPRVTYPERRLFGRAARSLF